MAEQELSLSEVLYVLSAGVQGIRAELRAMRLEQRAAMGVKLTEADAEALKEALTTADEVAALFLDDPEPEPARVLS